MLILVKDSITAVNSEEVTPADVKKSEKSLLTIKKQMTELIELYESGQLETIKRQDAPLSIKLIPNSDRI
jgi:hypothetical protein